MRTGYGDDVVRAHGDDVPDAAHVAADLMAAVAWVLTVDGSTGSMDPIGSAGTAGPEAS